MKHALYTILLLLCATSLWGGTKNVILEQCDLLSFDNSNGAEYQVLKGNVRFRHENALMYCDSAYFYDDDSFDAFGNVRVVDGGSTMTANSMHYDGKTLLMRIRGNVYANNDGTVLTTDALDFYRDRNFGYYFGGGKIVDADMTLTSQLGYYYTNTKDYYFKKDVVLNHPNYTIKSDSLQFNNETGKTVLVGPSWVFENDYTIYTTNAKMNRKTQVGRLYDYSVITSKSGRRITADSIYYDMERKIAKAYHNIDARDSTQKVIGRGNYAEFCRQFPAKGYMTDHAYVIDYSEKDSLYLAADTLYGLELDSTRSEIRGYHHVKFFREDMQGKCDSLVFSTNDSILSMYNDPVMWSEESQLTGEKIDVYFKNKRPDYIHIIKKAMIVQLEGEDMYNQLSGRESMAYLEKNSLKRVEMTGESASVYYSKDDNNELIGVNKAHGEAMTIYMKRGKKVEKIVMTPDSEGILYPPTKIPEDEKLLDNFSWLENLRPRSKEDIFTK